MSSDISEYDGSKINDFTRYKIGVSKFQYNPKDKEIKNMLYLLAYDISSPYRLRKVARICMDFGVRVEYSVFECDLKVEEFEELWNELAKTINKDEDSILAYRICGECVKKIESMGSIVRPEKKLFYMP